VNEKYSYKRNFSLEGKNEFDPADFEGIIENNYVFQYDKLEERTFYYGPTEQEKGHPRVPHGFGIEFSSKKHIIDK
jgi:hypothetical protein